ncbi:MraY family glycosyltransferase [Bacillus sp. JJ1533]|uniref:glycosyltransferase family 4 protein n=1 Tax=Bacillus sp. JJ1533 TaxID=3122959 RepID=UPI002FFD5B67
MYTLQYLLLFIIGVAVSFILTPFVIKIAHKIGAVDVPNKRKVHTNTIPRLGGLAIYFGFVITFIMMSFFEDVSWSILVGATIIVVTGILDDKFEIKPIQKLAGQIIAALIVLFNGLQIKVITIPFFSEDIQISWWIAFLVSFIWILGITNAVNLIDGLDGLAAGVSIIALTSIFIMSLIIGNEVSALLAIGLIGSTLGFLFFNFHPAKIFMGDTGSLLLGFLLSVMSLIGLKQVTFVTLVIPIIILAVPIIDTLIAIIRRKINRQGIMAPDKNHMHHRLLAVGFSHRKAVLMIYGIATFFGGSAILFYKANLLGSSLIFILLLIVIEFMIEKLSLISKNYKPMITMFHKIKVLLFGTVGSKG